MKIINFWRAMSAERIIRGIISLNCQGRLNQFSRHLIDGACQKSRRLINFAKLFNLTPYKCLTKNLFYSQYVF